MGCCKIKMEKLDAGQKLFGTAQSECKIYSMYFEVFSPLWPNIFLVCLLALHYFSLVFLFDIYFKLLLENMLLKWTVSQA